MHWLKDCPILTKCIECGSIIEIPEYKDHLLKACEKKSKPKYKECLRCKEPIKLSVYKEH